MAPTQTALDSFYKERKADVCVTRSHKVVSKGSLEDVRTPKKLSAQVKIQHSRGESPLAGMRSPQNKSATKKTRNKNTDNIINLKSDMEDHNDGVTLLLDDVDDKVDIASPTTKPLTPSKRRLTVGKTLCSPPKMKCAVSDNNASDSNTNKTASTPSTMLRQLTLLSPNADKNKKASLPPKSLFPEPNDLLSKARSALHTHTNTRLPGRENELDELQNYVLTHLQNKKSGSLYISGPPGTGKTACLSKVLGDSDLKQHLKIVNINCTSFGSPKAIYSRIAEQLAITVRVKTVKAYQEAIEKCLCSNSKMILMVLDEMDQLDTRSQSVLYTIFEWPLNFPTGIILIGIANALDLTDRLLPRLKAKLQLAPQLLHFAPYTKQQLIDIFLSRLEEADASKVFQPAALQLLASKLSAVNGDARRALDTARRAVEKESQRLIDTETNLDNIKTPKKLVPVTATSTEASVLRKSPRKAIAVAPYQHSLQEKGDQGNISTQKLKSPFASPQRSPLKSPVRQSSAAKENCSPSKQQKSAKKCLFGNGTEFPEPSSNRKTTSLHTMKEPCIDVMSILNVVNDVYGTSQSLGRTTTGGEELPLHQKLAVCTLLLILREGKSKDVTVGKLHDVYRRVCNKRHIEPLDASSFLSMLGLVEARGMLLLPGRGKRNRLTKICMQWIEDEVVSALQDRDLLAAILTDRSCLS